MSTVLHWLGIVTGVFGAICLGCFIAGCLCVARDSLRDRRKARKGTPPRWRSRLPLPVLWMLTLHKRRHAPPPAETPGEPLDAREQEIFAIYEKESR